MRVKRRESTVEGLSPLEAEIMNSAWRNAEITVRDVHEALLTGGYIPYTSVMAVMNSLVTKGLLTLDKSSRTYVYKPQIAREQLAVKIVDSVVDRILQGNAEPIATYLMDRENKNARQLAKT